MNVSKWDKKAVSWLLVFWVIRIWLHFTIKVYNVLKNQPAMIAISIACLYSSTANSYSFKPAEIVHRRIRITDSHTA